MQKSKHYYIRKAHRYLGIFLGLQFLMWTTSGIYFSWTDIDEVHGDFEHNAMKHLQPTFNFISPTTAINLLSEKADSIHLLQLVNILQKPFYSISYFSHDTIKQALADALTGNIRPMVSKEEAIKIAIQNFAGEPNVRSAEYITEAGNNDEYREKPLPAWKISFENTAGTHVYVSAISGKVETFRNDKWRTYDLLWMFHIMGYDGRDNINNWVLRVFSLIGLITVLSGFALFVVSSKWFKNKYETKKNIAKANVKMNKRK